ncbi:hypothetical protein M406DRAFT_67508 [Cryphonectria parasitica EP155]|uniref:Uncharacterized protein n=1 Tax=Cryphonectria parasitica (strain ATCC 38755 / EP155) TaxID=660469 RepID=A0A9P5CUA3_CRYP1|nr:uncharacterized protein M406DRAFT_67508 [Cryphonectria parasitica EP155]KAF3771183.1 hypothetical protein M406DRAFT_67508 [Cryphonectria parasitica EP155]
MDHEPSRTPTQHDRPKGSAGRGINEPVVFEVFVEENSSQDIGPWAFTVWVEARHKGEVVGFCLGLLIKRECIEARNGVKKPLMEAMLALSDCLGTLFTAPKVFREDGVIPTNVVDILDGGQLFPKREYAASLGKGSLEQPINRAWFLMLGDIHVNPQYRRLGIGGNMVRRALERVSWEAYRANRPLFAGAGPSRVDHGKIAAGPEEREVDRYAARQAEVFWQVVGFRKHKAPDLGLPWAWHFWGSGQSLLLEKNVVVPDPLPPLRKDRPPMPPQLELSSYRPVADSARSTAPSQAWPPVPPWALHQPGDLATAQGYGLYSPYITRSGVNAEAQPLQSRPLPTPQSDSPDDISHSTS